MQKYPIQQGITRMPVLIVPTEEGNLKDAYTQKVIVLTIVVTCDSTNKSCHLQLLHAKAIAAMTQFCEF